MSRARIDSLLASFPKVIPTNTQHTSVETADVRYVYQPLEDLYILLITNKASNILQDIETLHLFARVVSDMCRSAEQREILKNSFEILEAFDEIVSMGYRESVNLIQVRNILEMESHEEKIQEIIARVRVTGSTITSGISMSMRFTEQGSGSQRRTQAPCKAARNATTGATATGSGWWSFRSWLPRRRRFRLRTRSSEIRCPHPRPNGFACTVIVAHSSVQGQRNEAREQEDDTITALGRIRRRSSTFRRYVDTNYARCHDTGTSHPAQG